MGRRTCSNSSSRSAPISAARIRTTISISASSRSSSRTAISTKWRRCIRSSSVWVEAELLNAIELEVIYQSTLQIARELTLNMLRTGYSTIIKESQDFTFAIFDAQGRMVAQGIPQPLHIGPLNAQVNEIRRRFRDDTEPGDAFIVNHPYQACQNHATDVTVISPVFAAERLVGF